MKILVADDDALSRRLMQKMLEGNGYEVVTAPDGEAAVQILSGDAAPRLALVDWMMPGLDGTAVCRELRRQSKDAYTYVVLVTAKDSGEDVVAGLEAGADDYLTKPCSAEELKARLLTGRRILELEDRLVEAREAMRFKATHDSLTSLWDRGAILSLLRSELGRGSRSRQPFSVLLCDVDHFKRINDTHGHSAGDAVLREIASRLSSSVRSYDAIGFYADAIGRYGGEEFLLVLSDCDAAQVQKRAEAIRKAVACDPFPIPDTALSVTVSIGLTTIDGDNMSARVEAILEQVDAALYRAKAEGRNRCVFAELSISASEPQTSVEFQPV